MQNVDATAHEAREIDEVMARLRERFPTVGAERIRGVVEEEHRAFDGRPIRDFVPVFVERAAIERLRRPAA
ncbi:three-helix bundle dimerization domain-containing protein [Nakamurella sp.]|uniref:three-helix bundle dimerization domain-containing protein n=1 Tax=Nakamurella sp. TaxID=1869182 RepID=UPI00378327DD